LSGLRQHLKTDLSLQGEGVMQGLTACSACLATARSRCSMNATLCSTLAWIMSFPFK
jgi:hypothetical protein